MFVGLTGTLRVALALVAAVRIVTAVSFTGFTYPLFSMTTAAKVWSAILPFHYFYEIQQQQWNIGAPLSHVGSAFRRTLGRLHRRAAGDRHSAARKALS